MIISAGRFKGASLDFPKEKSFRPTQAKVREALISMLKPYLEGARVLDLCCGTGSMGLEALSQGAAHVTFVDMNLTFVYKNCKAICGEDDSQYLLKKSDAALFPKKAQTVYDIIIFDPPWQSKTLYLDSLKAISKFDILSPNGFLVCEHDRRVSLPDVSGLRVFKTKHYGDTALTFIKREQHDTKSDLSGEF